MACGGARVVVDGTRSWAFGPTEGRIRQLQKEVGPVHACPGEGVSSQGWQRPDQRWSAADLRYAATC